MGGVSSCGIESSSAVDSIRSRPVPCCASMIPTPARRTIDVQAFIDAHGVSSMQRRLIALCFLVVALDGFDTAIVGFIGPAERVEWNLAVERLGPLFAAGLFGLMI